MGKTSLEQSNKGNIAEQPRQSGRQVAWGIIGFIVGFTLLVYAVKVLFF